VLLLTLVRYLPVWPELPTLSRYDAASGSLVPRPSPHRDPPFAPQVMASVLVELAVSIFRRRASVDKRSKTERSLMSIFAQSSTASWAELRLSDT